MKLTADVKDDLRETADAMISWAKSDCSLPVAGGACVLCSRERRCFVFAGDEGCGEKLVCRDCLTAALELVVLELVKRGGV